MVSKKPAARGRSKVPEFRFYIFLPGYFSPLGSQPVAGNSCKEKDQSQGQEDTAWFWNLCQVWNFQVFCFTRVCSSFEPIRAPLPPEARKDA